MLALLIRDRCQPSSWRVLQSITSTTLSQPSLSPRTRQRSVAQWVTTHPKLS